MSERSVYCPAKIQGICKYYTVGGACIYCGQPDPTPAAPSPQCQRCDLPFERTETGWQCRQCGSSVRVREAAPVPSIESLPDKLGGKPVIAGTRFSVAQLLAELVERNATISETADAFQLPLETVKSALHELALSLDKPAAPVPDAGAVLAWLEKGRDELLADDWPHVMLSLVGYLFPPEGVPAADDVTALIRHLQAEPANRDAGAVLRPGTYPHPDRVTYFRERLADCSGEDCSACGWSCHDVIELLDAYHFLQAELAKAQAENERLKAQVVAHAERIAAQSELLGRRAEYTVHTCGQCGKPWSGPEADRCPTCREGG